MNSDALDQSLRKVLFYATPATLLTLVLLGLLVNHGDYGIAVIVGFTFSSMILMGSFNLFTDELKNQLYKNGGEGESV